MCFCGMVMSIQILDARTVNIYHICISNLHRSSCYSDLNPKIPLAISLFMGLAFGPAIWCTNLLCCVTSGLHENPLPHLSHWKGFWPVWSISWASNRFLVLSIFPQMLHLNCGSECCIICLFSTFLNPHRYPQTEHTWNKDSKYVLTGNHWHSFEFMNI